MDFSSTVERVRERAAKAAQEYRNSHLESEHLFIGLCELIVEAKSSSEIIPSDGEVTWLVGVFKDADIDAAGVARELRRPLRTVGGESFLGQSSSRLEEVFGLAAEHAKEDGPGTPVGVRHMLIALVIGAEHLLKEAVDAEEGKWDRLAEGLGLRPLVSRAVVDWRVGKEVLDAYVVTPFDAGHLFREGGMGRVYRVHHKEWNLDLAVKVPLSRAYRRPEGREVFIGEAQAWVDLGLHPHIATCFFVRTIDEVPCPFAEFVEGGSLADWIGTGRLYETNGGKELEARESLSHVLDIAIQTAWGLAYAHDEHKLIHQDVKPANILLTDDGTAKLADFGLVNARVKAGERSTSGPVGTLQLTHAGGLSGPYCSVEQAEAQRLFPDEKRTITRRTDVWSWGLCVLEMLAGRRFWTDGELDDSYPGEKAPRWLDQYKAGEVEGVPIDPTADEVLEHLKCELGALTGLLARCFDKGASARPPSRELAPVLIDIYARVAQEEYHREQPRAADLQADSLNNRAVSMLHLGKESEARRTFEEAHRVDPLHLWSRWNYDQCLWGRGELADDAVLGHVLALSAVRGYRRDAEDMHGASAGARHGMSRGPQGPVAFPPRLLFDSSTHCGKVTGLCLEGGELISAGSDARICVVDTTSGKIKKSFPSPLHEPVSSMSSRSAAGLVAIGGRYGGLWLLDTLRHRFATRCKLQQHSGPVRGICMSRDGRFVSSGGWDRRAVLQDRNGTVIDEIEFGCPVEAVGVTPTGQLLAAGWKGRVETSSDTSAFPHPHDAEFVGEPSAGAMDVSPSCARVLIGWSDGTLLLADSQSGVAVCRAMCGPRKSIESCSLTSGGGLGASGGWDCAARVWGLRSGKNAVCLRTFENADVPVTAVCLSADGDMLAIGDMFGRIQVWHLGSMVEVTEKIRAVPARLSVPPSYEDLGKDSEELVQAESLASERERQGVGDVLEPLRAWQSKPGHEVDRRVLNAINRRSAGQLPIGIRNAWPGLPIFCDAPVLSVAWSPDGQDILAGLSNGICVEYDTSRGSRVRDYRLAETTMAAAVTYTASGQYIAAAGSSNVLHVWPKGRGSAPFQVELGDDPEAPLMALSAGDDPNTIYATGFGRMPNVIVWQVACAPTCCHGKERFDQQTLWGGSLQLAASGRRIVGVSADGAIRLWGLGDGMMKVEFTGCRGWPVDALVDGPDEQWLICLDDSGSLTWYDWRASRVMGRFAMHETRPKGIVRLAGRGCVATVDADGLLVLWDFVNGCCHPIRDNGSGPATCIGASPDGHRLAVGRSGGILELWDLDWLWPSEAMERRVLETQSLDRCSADSRSQRDALLEQTIAGDVLLVRNQRSQQTPPLMLVAYRIRAIQNLNRLVGDHREIGRFARLLQAYWCGTIGEYDMVLRVTRCLAELNRRDAMGWNIRSMAYDMLRRSEDAYDAIRLGDHYGAPESRSFLPALRTELATDLEDHGELGDLSLCTRYGLGRPRVRMTDTSALYAVVAGAVGFGSYGLFAFVPQLGMTAIASQAAVCLASVAGFMFWVCFRATQLRTSQRRSLLPRREPRSAKWTWPILEKEKGDSGHRRRVLAATTAGLTWSAVGLLLLLIGRASTPQRYDLWNLVMSGVSEAVVNWWQGLGLATLLLGSLLPSLRSLLARRVISLKRDALPSESHLFERQGNVVIVDERAIRRVNPELVRHARCPRCGSRLLMWYKTLNPLAYYNPAQPVRLEKGLTIHMQCRECRYRDCADL